MKRTKMLLMSGAAVLGLTAGGISIYTAAAGASPRSQSVSSTITFDFPGEVLAPPPPGAAPALTAEAAIVQAMNVPAGPPIPSDVSVQFGLYTLPAGPAAQCEADNSCGTDTIVGDTAYEDHQILAYGYEWSVCGGSLTDGCAEWEFVNANTGTDLGGIRPRPTAPTSPSTIPSSPSAAPESPSTDVGG